MKNKECQSTGHKSKIGGQALIEGVMMRGIDKAAMSVRLPDGGIDTDIQRFALQLLAELCPSA